MYIPVTILASAAMLGQLAVVTALVACVVVPVWLRHRRMVVEGGYVHSWHIRRKLTKFLYRGTLTVILLVLTVVAVLILFAIGEWFFNRWEYWYPHAAGQ